MESCCICGTVKNCGPYLSKVLENVTKITSLFIDYQVIIYYDDSTDDSHKLLKRYKKKYKKVHIHHNKIFKSDYRTHRLAFGRNYCLKKINKHYSHFKYFIMMDFDNVCFDDINISVLENHINNDYEWDALSFNKKNYYDIWALSIRPYIFSYAHFNDSDNVSNDMNQYITKQLTSMDKNKLLPCYSAFNGFSIYKTNIFKDSYYDGKICLNLIPPKYIEETKNQNNSDIVFNDKDWLHSKYEDCEHRSFHFYAIYKKNARILISPEILF
jgi:hypothetical protein